jgi:magnesium transporter
MTLEPQVVDQALTRRFLLDYPREAAHRIETLDPKDFLDAVAEQPVHVLLPVWRRLVPATAAELLTRLPEDLQSGLLGEMEPQDAARLLGQLPEQERQTQLARLPNSVHRELTTLMEYPENSAGRLMNPRVPAYRGTLTAAQALDSLRREKMKTSRSLFLIDDEGRLNAKVFLQDIAIAAPETPLRELSQPVTAAVQSTAPREEVSELFEKHQLLDLPVVDIQGRMLGMINHSSLVQVSQEDASSDVLAMVGASREERALSKPFFSVKKRMPWMQINLVTAFMAAAVVGLFENTIAQYTALAVLLPVVAGQSGNAGAQALAVTMRGLALREITARHWLQVMFKEIRVGFMNGIGIAVTCGLGVYAWSGSPGLVIVIASSMILAMVMDGFAGAVVPIALVRLGQDPAQASSIILTTVTDIAGFFSFLGIATMLSGLL